MKRRKETNRKPGDWIIDSMEASYKDKNGIRMWYGWGRGVSKNHRRQVLVVDFSKSMFKSYYESKFSWYYSNIILYGGDGSFFDGGGLLADLEYVYMEYLLRKFKVAHRWFLKYARKIRYFNNYTLSDFLKPDGYTLDIKKANDACDEFGNKFTPEDPMIRILNYIEEDK